MVDETVRTCIVMVPNSTKHSRFVKRESIYYMMLEAQDAYKIKLVLRKLINMYNALHYALTIISKRTKLLRLQPFG